MGLVFEWDRRKADQNLRKQRASFQEAKTIFGDPEEFMFGDPDHSEDEEHGSASGFQMKVECFWFVTRKSCQSFASSVLARSNHPR